MEMVEEDLTKWVLSVERRVMVLKAVDASGAFSAADVAERCGRSVQNMSRAIRELEVKGLIECLNPEKRTWKRYLLTDLGRTVYRDLKSKPAPDQWSPSMGGSLDLSTKR
jgi:predicted transcriptional regulator